jgi:hypothetical protein
MNEAQPPKDAPPTDWSLTWRGALAFGLLATLGVLGPDLIPSPYFPDFSHYVERVVVLALAVGMGIAALRSSARGDRVIGLAVVIVGLALVLYIAAHSINRLSR